MVFFILYSEHFINFIQKIDINNFFDKTVYNDLDREWFNDVGTKILITMMISIFNPSLVYIFKMWIVRCIKNIQANGAKTMREYIVAKTPMEFDIEQRFAWVLNIFFISMTLSGGIPLLIIVSWFTFGLLFFIEKKVFNSYTKKPPMYTGIIMSYITKFLPIASLLSIFVSIYVLGNPNLYPSTESNETLDALIVSFLTSEFYPS